MPRNPQITKEKMTTEAKMRQNRSNAFKVEKMEFNFWVWQFHHKFENTTKTTKTNRSLRSPLEVNKGCEIVTVSLHLFSFLKLRDVV